MSNLDILSKIESTLKSLTTTDLGSTRLNPEKSEKFVQTLSDAQTILKDARRLDMNSHTRDIDRIGFGGRILRGAQEGVAPAETVKPVFATNKLEAKEVIAVIPVTDSTMEDNIEQAGFEDTLLSMVANRAAADLEELFIKGDTASTDVLLKVTDGWLKKAANKVTAGTGAGKFDAKSVEGMFEAQLVALPAQFIRNRDELAFYVSFDVENAFRNALRGRNTDLGDVAYTANGGLTYKGIEVKMASFMPAGTSMLVPKANLVYGVYRDIRIEKDRYAAARRTDFVVTMRVDAHFEDQNGAVVASGYTGV